MVTIAVVGSNLYSGKVSETGDSDGSMYLVDTDGQTWVVFPREVIHNKDNLDALKAGFEEKVFANMLLQYAALSSGHPIGFDTINYESGEELQSGQSLNTKLSAEKWEDERLKGLVPAVVQTTKGGQSTNPGFIEEDDPNDIPGMGSQEEDVSVQPSENEFPVLEIVLIGVAVCIIYYY